MFVRRGFRGSYRRGSEIWSFGQIMPGRTVIHWSGPDDASFIAKEASEVQRIHRKSINVV